MPIGVMKLYTGYMKYALFVAILNVVSTSQKPNIVIFLADDLVSKSLTF